MSIKNKIESGLVAETQQDRIQAMLGSGRIIPTDWATQLKRWQSDSLRLCERDEARLNEMHEAWKQMRGEK